MGAVMVICAVGNGLGATLMFVYFSIIESGLRPQRPPVDFTTNLLFFAAATGFIIAVVSILGVRITRPVWKDLDSTVSSSDPKKLEWIVGEVLNTPLRMAGLSLLGWLMSAAIFSFLPPAFHLFYGGNWHEALRVLFGILFVGTPLTVFFVYFVLEWMFRNAAKDLFPPGALVAAPSSAKINVLPKMILVSLLIGTVPVSIVSYVTLHQIVEIEAGRLAMSSFVSQMPAVVVFLLVLAVSAALGLSVLLSRSVSEPLRTTGAAMDRVRKGDLEVSVPVVSNDEIGVMAEGFNRMVGGLKERDLIRDTFGSYLSEDVVAEILESPGGLDLGGELREITILVSDLRGFTTLSESLEPRVIVELINRYFETMTDIIMRHGGTIDEFTGDGILVFFGAPRAFPDHPQRAVDCAIEMQSAMQDLNTRNLELGLPGLEMGIGINCGELVVGNIGSEKRKKYGAVGNPINVAFRVEGQTSGGEILITPTVQRKIRSDPNIVSSREAQLKGIDEPLTLYQVAGPNT